jgi:hypothetical protein
MVNAGVERTLLSAAFDFGFDLVSDLDVVVVWRSGVTPKSTAKPVGQECPTHTKRTQQTQKGQSGAPETVPLNPPG